jgi:hypothetical protein
LTSRKPSSLNVSSGVGVEARDHYLLVRIVERGRVRDDAEVAGSPQLAR